MKIVNLVIDILAGLFAATVGLTIISSVLYICVMTLRMLFSEVFV